MLVRQYLILYFVWMLHSSMSHKIRNQSIRLSKSEETIKITLVNSVNEDDVNVLGGYIGKVQKLVDGEPIASFKGIPYAIPPIGNLRYKPPVPFVETKVRDATEFGHPCLQWDLFNNYNVTGDEDCLTLNIFVPKKRLTKPTEDLMPVMVFFHGIGFVAGQVDTYNPEHIVENDVIVVTVQYRLGILGFLSTGDSMLPGNMGLLDQVEALRWIKKNIAVFGGDPDLVTIFGQSAGAVSVALHLVSPLTKGLFHNAIIQSGTFLGPHIIQKSPASFFRRLAMSIGCVNDNNMNVILDCVRYSDPRELVQMEGIGVAKDSTGKTIKIHKKNSPLGPTIQLENTYNWPNYLPEDPLILLKKGHFHRVPVIIGITRDESASAVINNLIPRLINLSVSDPTYVERVFLRKVAKNAGFTENLEVLKRAIRFEYFKNYPLQSIFELKDEHISLQSDFSIISPAYQTAILLSKFTSTYFYTFEHEGVNSFADLIHSSDRSPREASGDERMDLSPEFSNELEKLSAEAITLSEQNRYIIHGEELLYLFRFRNPYSGSIVSIEDPDGVKVRQTIVKLWSNMAKFSNPNGNQIENPNRLNNWQPFEENAPYTYRIANSPSLLISYRHRKMLFWSMYLPELEQVQLVCK